MLNDVTWNEAKENGEGLFYATDPGANWDFDDIVLYRYKRKYVLFFDSGCSCPIPFENNPKGDSYTKAQLLKVVKNWNGDRTEKVMKDWILENIK